MTFCFGYLPSFSGRVFQVQIAVLKMTFCFGYLPSFGGRVFQVQIAVLKMTFCFEHLPSFGGRVFQVQIAVLKMTFCFGYLPSFGGRVFQAQIAVLKMTFCLIFLGWGGGGRNLSCVWCSVRYHKKGALVVTFCSLISLPVSRKPEHVHQILAYRGFQVSLCLFFFLQSAVFVLCTHAI